MIVLLNIRARGKAFFRPSIAEFLWERIRVSSAIDSVKDSTIFIGEQLWSVLSSAVSCLLFAAIFPVMASYLGTESIAMNYSDLALITVSLVITVFPLLVLHTYITNRFMIHFHLQRIEQLLESRMDVAWPAIFRLLSLFAQVVAWDIRSVSASKGKHLSLAVFVTICHCILCLAGAVAFELSGESTVSYC